MIASEETGMELNADRTNYMVMFGDQNAGQSHYIKNGNSFFEMVDSKIWEQL